MEMEVQMEKETKNFQSRPLLLKINVEMNS